MFTHILGADFQEIEKQDLHDPKGMIGRMVYLFYHAGASPILLILFYLVAFSDFFLWFFLNSRSYALRVVVDPDRRGPGNVAIFLRHP